MRNAEATIQHIVFTDTSEERREEYETSVEGKIYVNDETRQNLNIFFLYAEKYSFNMKIRIKIVMQIISKREWKKRK